MRPRSLLFCSDEETSRQVGTALQQLELDVECCREIFAALEMLTSRGYDVIVADWDEGAEATFFLETARNLKSDAFSVAVIGAVANIATCGFDVDLILRKPASAEQVKYSLLACDRFVISMRAWMARWNTTAPYMTASLRMVEGAGSSRLRNPRTIPREAVPGARVEASPLFARAPEGEVMQQTREEEAAAAAETSLGIGQGKIRRGVEPGKLLLAALAIAGIILAAGKSLENRPSRNALVTGAGFVPQILRQAIGNRLNWVSSLGLPQATEEPDEISRDRVSSEDGRTRSRSADSKIRVLELRTADSLKPALFVPETRPQDSDVLAPVSDQAPQDTAEASDGASKVEAGAPPESLRSSRWQSPEANRAPEDSLQLTRTLQPVELSEGSAEKLLLKRTQPYYPEQALRTRVEGVVVLEAWIGVDGEIRELKLIRGSLLLGQAACEAVRNWRYRPYLVNGRAVEAETMVTIDFRLP